MNITVPIEPVDINKLKIEDLLQQLITGKLSLKGKTITAGFDGFIDTLVDVIKMKEEEKQPELFSTIAEFGQYIVSRQGASLSIEMAEKNVKLGGNMPIMANALGHLGAAVHCIGALGYPHPHPIFESFAPGCTLHSFANPGFTTALEFNDGKIMMGNMGELNTSGWEKIRERIGLEKIKTVYQQSELICILNWSEIDASTDIWKGLLNDIINSCSGLTKTKSVFFDLSDCSKRSDSLIKEALQLLAIFSQHTKVLLSLNKNEAGIIHRIVMDSKSGNELPALGGNLYERLSVDTLILHSARESIAYDTTGSFYCKSFYTGDPKISTGAGDNFNAGFCAGHLLNLSLEQSLIMANAVSGFYVRNGTSASWNELITFLQTQ